MKLDIKKILFIIVCAELLLWYRSVIEVRNTHYEIVYHNNEAYHWKTPQPASNPAVSLKQAS
ncbi:MULTISPECIES: hypothetical protein [Paenibacillus]|uniref:Uncharacterized protein n=1 Tax=Paenibacillus baimaensis TaxID=2982185 RepID=A0ABT2UJC1_9BACL|nr:MULTISPECIES: hypothetical protein [unclassified Paenibacillus]MCU6794746.1 hypothetical protein [Paenibacillus sp. WQ 127069]OMF19568.1 hypothetical protein BK127_06430 [Paenibacillus sp. FSL H7-0331]